MLIFPLTVIAIGYIVYDDDDDERERERGETLFLFLFFFFFSSIF
jgi:hypothetical protein